MFERRLAREGGRGGTRRLRWVSLYGVQANAWLEMRVYGERVPGWATDCTAPFPCNESKRTKPALPDKPVLDINMKRLATAYVPETTPPHPPTNKKKICELFLILLHCLEHKKNVKILLLENYILFIFYSISYVEDFIKIKWHEKTSKSKKIYIFFLNHQSVFLYF